MAHRYHCPKARQAVSDEKRCKAKLDARRIAYLISLCSEAGIAAPDASEALYAMAVGLETLGATDAHRTMSFLLSGL